MYIYYSGFEFDNEMQQEMEAIETYFPGSHGSSMARVPPGEVVLPRFRALPFGRDLEAEFALKNCKLINTFGQHRFAADLGQWYEALRPDVWKSDFERLTPMSCRTDDELGRMLIEYPVIVKGETNSRRGLWKTHCFVPTEAELGQTIANLTADSMIGYQPLWMREFIPLHSYFDDVVGMPVSEEYRVFYYDGVVLAKGFYWGNHLEDILEAGHPAPDPDEIPGELLKTVGDKIRHGIKFTAVDFARTAEGKWIVIEVNDGSMAGCCGVDPMDLYAGLAAVAKGWIDD
jgi:hypothetical protein